MSKSYSNVIELRDDSDTVVKKLRTMPTDPARVRRTDPGDPEKCPVWPLHQVYSDEATQDWVQQGCRSADIGCLQCKQPVIDGVLAELEPMRERAREFESSPELLRKVVDEGCEAARDVARRFNPKMALNLDMGSYDFCNEGGRNCGALSLEETGKLSNVLRLKD